jgi:hypothetical protein
LAGRDHLDWETQDASAALSARDIAGGDLVFVGGEGCQDFGFLALRDLREVQGPPEFSCDLIEFCRGDPAAANRVASESNVSADPTWISVGGKPRKSANRGEMSGFLRLTNVGT